MDQETSEILFGAAILIPFLIAVFAAGLVLNRFKNRRFHAAWRPLVPVIDGTVVDDGGGAASSWLTGTFEGRRVHASMTPNRSTVPGSALKYNYFELAVGELAGEHNWRVEYTLPTFGFGSGEWRIIADELPLAQRLERAGVLDIVAGMQAGARPASPTLPAVNYLKNAATLTYCEDVGGGWTPAPDRFRHQLALLIQLAAIHTQMNSSRR
jgi:hypothetical protein